MRKEGNKKNTVEISETQFRRIEKIKPNQVWFSGKINEADQLLDRLTKKIRFQFRNERGDIMTSFTEIKRIN